MAELPPKPRKPDLDECCGSGCDPCVFDVYHDAVEAWKRACREIEAKANTNAKDEASINAGASAGANGATANASTGATASASTSANATPQTAPAGTPRDPASGRGA